jgi:hypothetical protein
MSSLDHKTFAKFSAVCARLASDHDGERAAAALLASRMLSGAGITWADLVEAAFAAPAPIYAPPPPSAPQTQEPRYYDPLGGMEVTLDLLEELLDLGDVIKINQWERGFLEKLIAQENTDLSAKQRMSLSWILRKRDAAAAKAERAAAKSASGRQQCAA